MPYNCNDSFISSVC